MSEGFPDRDRPVTDVKPRVAGSSAADPLPLHRPYPELAPVISLAVDAVVYLFDLDEETDRAVIQRLNEVATIRTVDLYTTMTAIATRSAEGARRSREIRAVEVARAADELAARVAGAAADLQAREEAQAATAAGDAAAAAGQVAAAGVDP